VPLISGVRVIVERTAARRLSGNASTVERSFDIGQGQDAQGAMTKSKSRYSQRHLVSLGVGF